MTWILLKASFGFSASLQKVDGIYQFLPTKNDSSRRFVPLFSEMTAGFKAHWEHQVAEWKGAGEAWSDREWAGLVFTNELGDPLAEHTVSRRFTKLLRLAGLSGHDLQ